MWTWRNSFVELNAAQRSPEWFAARNRITASVYESVLGLSRFGTKQDAIDRILGKIGPKPENEAMRLGKENEDPVRDWYAKKFKVEVIEPSLCVSLRYYDFPMSWEDGTLLSQKYPSQLDDPLHPNWFIGGSPDGELILPDGVPANMEIKFTKNIYSPLAQYNSERIAGTWEPYPRYTQYHDEVLSTAFRDDIKKYGFPFETGAIDFFPHIWSSHFMQMQGCMAILDKQACIYLVGSPTQRYVERVPFDEVYWRYFLYPSLINVVENDIKPAMSDEFRDNFVNEVKKIISIVPDNAESVIPYVSPCDSSYVLATA